MQTQGEAIIGQSQPEAGTVTSPSREALNVKRCDYMAERSGHTAVNCQGFCSRTHGAHLSLSRLRARLGLLRAGWREQQCLCLPEV